MTGPNDDVDAAVRGNYAAQRDSMVAGDAPALAEQLTENFTLTHMTGYEQPRRDWLTQVPSGEMAYHRITDVAVTVGGDATDPVLTARTRTDATIWGGRGTWPLQLEIHFTHDTGQWLSAYTIASTR
ncbi:nuclear transport factor 2 family protein [Terrabacter carboxydivorans]|uniref:Nuclear transport factor 2 family protein n=1 Tax=Terrabacter carboxydivorans TaxID=619730 RepID=A0ABN3M5V4_9MICO